MRSRSLIKLRMVAVTCGLSGLAAIRLATSQAATLTSEVKQFKGLPSLYVNGKLTSSLFGYVTSSKDLQDFLKAGFTIMDLSLPYDGSEKSGYWTGPKEYNFDKVDTEIESYLKQDPRILLLPKINPVPGAWWCNALPNDITLQSDGTPTDASVKQPCHFSFASEKYRSLSREALIALVTHLENKYGNNILGYHLENGLWGEWFSWGAYLDNEPREHFGVEDYSWPAQTAFKHWLRQKYRDKPEEIQRAWGDPIINFQSAAIPSEAVRKHPTHGIFFDPSISRQVPDYFEFLNEIVAGVLLEQCQTI